MKAREDVVFLPQPVAAVDALLQLQGVVGQVVMDHKGGFLQVETPGAVVGGEQHFPAPLESLDGGIVCAAAVQRGLVLALQQREKHILRFHALGENDRFPRLTPFFHRGEAQLEGVQQLCCLGLPFHFQRRPFHLPPLGICSSRRMTPRMVCKMAAVEEPCSPSSRRARSYGSISGNASFTG